MFLSLDDRSCQHQLLVSVTSSTHVKQCGEWTPNWSLPHRLRQKSRFPRIYDTRWGRHLSDPFRHLWKLDAKNQKKFCLLGLVLKETPKKEGVLRIFSVRKERVFEELQNFLASVVVTDRLCLDKLRGLPGTVPASVSKPSERP